MLLGSEFKSNCRSFAPPRMTVFFTPSHIFLAYLTAGSRVAPADIRGNHSLLSHVYHGKRARSRLEVATMGQLALALVLTALTAAAQSAGGLQGPAQQTSPEPRIVVPAGTSVPLALTAPLLTRSAKAGESVYAETAFPVVVNNQMAIPPGTYVQGQIDSLMRPGWLSPHAQFQMHFTKIIFSTGYTVQIADLGNTDEQPPTALPALTADASAQPLGDDIIAAVSTPYVEVRSVSDVLLDNGSQIEMVLQVPLSLNAAKVAAAVLQSRSRPPAQFKSATRCRPIPATPGTPDTVIPGTPGTPPTVIPGGPGMPDTVIPGTPGTPPTVISGSPGSPEMPCPGPPIVLPNSKPQVHRKPFRIASQLGVYGTLLAAGSYQFAWNGPGPTAQVEISENGNLVARVPARVVLLKGESSTDTIGTTAKADGSLSLASLRFAGEKLALYFDQAAR